MDEATVGMSETQIRQVSMKIVRLQTDTFYNECRAYGKIINHGVNGKVAVHCHGHLAIPAAMEEELAERFEVERGRTSAKIADLFSLRHFLVTNRRDWES